MTTFQNNLNVPQMTTPLNELPLKTTEYSSDELDDPLIKGVLKEFEDEYLYNKKQDETNKPERNVVLEQQQPPNNIINDNNMNTNMHANMHANASMYIHNQDNDLQRLNYNKESDKFFDIQIAKKALIISLVFFIVFNLNIFDYLLKNVPESFKSYVEKNGTFINILLLFVIIYSLFKFEFI